jgi:hypothetical protein
MAWHPQGGVNPHRSRAAEANQSLMQAGAAPGSTGAGAMQPRRLHSSAVRVPSVSQGIQADRRISKMDETGKASARVIILEE